MCDLARRHHFRVDAFPYAAACHILISFLGVDPCHTMHEDVQFQHDPFEGMVKALQSRCNERRNLLVRDDLLFVGRDSELFRSMRAMPWLNRKFQQCFGHSPLPLQEQVLDLPVILNAGNVRTRIIEEE